jgi:hypothetical protein
VVVKAEVNEKITLRSERCGVLKKGKKGDKENSQRPKKGLDRADIVRDAW